MSTEITIAPTLDLILATGQFNANEKVYLFLASGQRVKELNPIELKDFCINLFSLIYLNKGLAPLPPQLLADKGKLLAVELGSYQSHTFVNDIREAVRRGSLNMLGETYYEHKDGYDAYNNACVMTWIGKYLFENTERTNALAKKSAIEGKLKTEPMEQVTPEEAYQISLDVYKRTKQIHDIGNTVCRWLWNTKQIICPKEHWAELMNRAELKIKLEYERERDKAIEEGRLADARKFNTLLKSWGGEKEVSAEASRLLLKEHYEKVISSS